MTEGRRRGPVVRHVITVMTIIASFLVLTWPAEAHDAGFRVKWREIALQNLGNWPEASDVASNYTGNSNLDVTAYDGVVYGPGIVRITTTKPQKWSGDWTGAAIMAADYQGYPHFCTKYPDLVVIPGACASAPPSSPGQPDKRVTMGWVFINSHAAGHGQFSGVDNYYQRMLTHESGHVFGLDHPDACDSDAVMSPLQCFFPWNLRYELGTHDTTDLGNYYP